MSFIFSPRWAWLALADYTERSTGSNAHSWSTVGSFVLPGGCFRCWWWGSTRGFLLLIIYRIYPDYTVIQECILRSCRPSTPTTGNPKRAGGFLHQHSKQEPLSLFTPPPKSVPLSTVCCLIPTTCSTSLQSDRLYTRDCEPHRDGTSSVLFTTRTPSTLKQAAWHGVLRGSLWMTASGRPLLSLPSFSVFKHELCAWFCD